MDFGKSLIAAVLCLANFVLDIGPERSRRSHPHQSDNDGISFKDLFTFYFPPICLHIVCVLKTGTEDKEAIRDHFLLLVLRPLLSMLSFFPIQKVPGNWLQNPLALHLHLFLTKALKLISRNLLCLKNCYDNVPL